jgi:putative sigma-54 modulation protein
MDINIQGKGMDVSDYLKGIVNKKVGKLKKYFKPETIAHVTLSIEKSRHIAEVTIPFDGIVLRAEETSTDMYSSIDGCLKKLEHQIMRHRTKLEKRLHHEAFKEEQLLFHDAYIEEEIPKLVRTKRLSVKPMSLDEAVMQMELVGHSFFVFRDAEYDEINVIYKRKDGNIGLIETS